MRKATPLPTPSRVAPNSREGIKAALSQVIANPDQSHAWHALGGVVSQSQAALNQNWLMHRIQEKVPSFGLAGFLRATFLAELTGDRRFSQSAGRLGLTLSPQDPQRLMAFALYEWARELSKSHHRLDFIAALRGAQLPEIMSALSRHPADIPTLNPRNIPSIQKVAVVVPHLSADGHIPTKIAFNHAQVFQDLGLNVQIFSPQESRIDQMGSYLGSNGSLLLPPFDWEDLKSIAPPNIQIHLGLERLPLVNRWQGIGASLAQFDPDLIAFIGLFSPMVHRWFEDRPTLGLSIHSVAPMAPLDVWLTSDKANSGQLIHQWGPSTLPCLGYHHPFRVKLRPKSNQITRGHLCASENKIILVCVGSRLQHEIEGEWSQRMSHLLDECPELLLVLVGGLGVRPPTLTPRASDQVFLIPQQLDVQSILSVCDLYVNPVRVGGGFSVAEAMAEGLPVLSLADSDGGDKLGPFASTSLIDYFEALRALIKDPEARKTLGSALQQRFHSELNLDASGPSLQAACALTLDRFHQRVRPSSA